MTREDQNAILRGVSNAISTHIAPEVNSALAKDAATFGAGLLRGLLLQGQAEQRIGDYEKALLDTVRPALGSAQPDRDGIGAWIEKLYLQADSPGADAKQILAAVASEEKRLQSGIRADDQAEDERAKAVGKLGTEAVDAPGMTNYLQQKFKRSDIEVSSIRLIPGGGSKITRIISLQPVPGLPAELIMRQDYAVNHVGNSIVSEYPLLTAMHGARLPVAAPLLLEAGKSSLGAPFMLVNKVEGRNIGNLWGFFPGTDPKPLCIELAQLLAKIHQLRPDQIAPSDKDAGADKKVALRERVLQQISDIHGKWARGRGDTSPVIALSLLWLRENLDTEDAVPAVVHGDCAFTNILVHEGRISALLDWEFAHIGDPAEDLAYIKDVVEQVMPWQDFIGVYCAAGGKAPSAARLYYFDVWRALRNVIYAGLAGESFLSGGNHNLMLGWAGIYATPLLEHQLMGMIGDDWKK